MSKILSISINPEYEKLVPPLSDLEYNELADSIGKNGLWVPIITNQNGVILDGHHRYKICKKYDIYPEIRIKKFYDKNLEAIFVIECNEKRRHLIPAQRVLLQLRKKPYLSNIAEIHSKIGKKLDQSENFRSGKVSTQLAKSANVSDRTFEKCEKVLLSIREDLKIAILSGKLSIDDSYQRMKKDEKKKERQDQIKKKQINLPETIQLYNKPFQKLSIPKNSVGLIITDPPYAEEHLHLYEDLAEQASKVLRDGGSLLCYAGHFCIDRVIDYMKKHGLKYHWIISVVHSGPSASVFGRKILVGYKPMLWFTKGKYEGEFVKDCIKSEFQGKELHEWAQSTKESDYYIEYMTLPNDIVYDPFMGQGTFGMSAKYLKRQFIGAEINKDHFENARRLLSN